MRARLLFLSTLSLILLALPVRAQSDGGTRLLDQVRAAQEIRAQRMEADVRDALREADKYARSDPARARAALEGALVNLQDDTDLSASRRESLVKSVKDRLARLGVDQNQLDRAAAERAQKIAAQQGQRPVPLPRPQDSGRPAANDPAAAANARIAAANSRVGDNARLKNERDSRYAQVNDNLEKSLIPPSTEKEFPPDWKERIAKRPTGQRMTTREAAVMKALGTPIDVEFKGDRLEDVIDYLSKKMHVTILLDKEMLDRLGSGVSYDSKVTFSAKDVTLRTVLRRVLGDFGLTHLVMDETITVLPQEEARKTMITRAYPIAELSLVTNSPFGPVGNQLQTIQNINQLVGLIYQTIEPSVWKINGKGGEGTIAFEPQTMSLLIRAPAELHSKLGGPIK